MRLKPKLAYRLVVTDKGPAMRWCVFYCGHVWAYDSYDNAMREARAMYGTFMTQFMSAVRPGETVN